MPKAAIPSPSKAHRAVSPFIIAGGIVVALAVGVLAFWSHRSQVTPAANQVAVASPSPSPSASPASTATPVATPTPTATPIPSPTAETWTLAGKLVSNRTSTDTLVLPNGTGRMYYQDKAAVYYQETTDWKTWGAPQPTGITQAANTMMSNPAVLQAKDGSWIMLYEQHPGSQPSQGSPGPNNRRDLYLATSTDGMHFVKVGMAIDSSKADSYFASVPDLVLMPNGNIRLYYVSLGNAVGSALSTDNGKTWTKEAGQRLGGGAVDPDVLYDGGMWIMYYSQLSNTTNGIFKAYSADGLQWTELPGTVVARTASQHLVDPDVVAVGGGSFRMFYGIMSTTNSQTPIDLYQATFTGTIF